MACFDVQIQKVTSKFSDLSTSREVPQEEDGHLAVAAKTYEMFIGFSDNLKEDIPDFLGDDYYEKLERMVELTRGGSLSNFLSHPV